MTIFENEQVNVYFDESIPAVVWCPSGFLKGDKFRAPFMAGMDFIAKNIEKYPNITWLNDARNLKTVGTDDVKWLNSNVNDKAYQLGMKRVAFVLPDNVFGKWGIKLYVDFTNKRSDNKLDIKAFRTIDEAKSWLKLGQGANVSFL